MSAFVKKYPRARVSPHATLNGWVVDIVMGPKSRASRVPAAYATISFAVKAAHSKLGVPTTPGEVPTVKSARAQKPRAISSPVKLPPAGSPSPEIAAENIPENIPAAPRGRAPRGERSTGTCEPCGRPMRPAGSKASAHPGTTLRQREGLCQSCHQRSLRTGAAA